MLLASLPRFYGKTQNKGSARLCKENSPKFKYHLISYWQAILKEINSRSVPCKDALVLEHNLVESWQIIAANNAQIKIWVEGQ